MIYSTVFFCAASYFVLVKSLPLDDPTEWPGHLEAFGSKQNMIPVEEVYDWPSPQDFFNNYVSKSKPLLVRGIYKYLKPTRWDDNSLRGKATSEKSDSVFVELSLKENRTNVGGLISLYDFVKFYKKRELLSFSIVPDHLMKDVLLPSPIKCNSTRKLLVNAIAVISQGGSRSMVYNDDVETIYCTYQGSVDSLLIEYTKNKNHVIDRPQGGYSTVDVDRVDYAKYPNLRKIDAYVKASMKEGDCLYIPYRWYKQQNSFANQYGRSIAINFWFNHVHHHEPSDCSITDDDATIDKYTFSDLLTDKVSNRNVSLFDNGETFQKNPLDRQDEDEEEENASRSLLNHFKQYFQYLKYNEMKLKHFIHLLKKDDTLVPEEDDLEFPDSFKILAAEMFNKLDANQDMSLTEDELVRESKQEEKELHDYLEYQVARIEDYVEDLIEAKHHDEPIEDFEERMMERFRSQKHYDEL